LFSLLNDYENKIYINNTEVLHFVGSQISFVSVQIFF